MKKVILTTVFFTITNFGNAGEVAKQTETVAAQIQVTHDSLQQVLAKMRNTPTESSQFTHPDFVYAASLFNARAERAMIHFEDTLKTIFSHIDYFEKRIDAIRRSNAYSDSQKGEILSNQYQVLQVEFEKYSRDYQDALVKLITLDLPLASGHVITPREGIDCNDRTWRTFYIEFPVAGISVKVKDHDYLVNRNCDGTWQRDLPLDIYLMVGYDGNETLKETIRQEVTKHALLRPCISSGCISLMSELRKNYVSLIEKELFRDIQFNSFKLISNPGYDSARGEGTRTLSISNLKSRFGLKAEETRDLPFDISEDDFARVQQKRIKDDKSDREGWIEDIRDYVTASRRYVGMFGDWECRAKDIREKAARLCEKTFIGCLNPDEADGIVKAIKAEYTDPKQQEVRIKCLNDNTN